MRVSIHPWGDPRNWRFVEYCSEELCVKGFSPLSLIASSPSARPDLVIIFVLDTLYDKNCDPGLKYDSMVDAVRREAFKYLCFKDSLDVRIEVLPGIMKKRARGIEAEFRAAPDDARLEALYYTYKHVTEKLKQAGDSRRLEILLDTTHGVNYFTILVREAVFEAASMLAAHGREVAIKVLNTDPFSSSELPRRSAEDPCRPEPEGPVMRVEHNLLQRAEIPPWEITKYLRYSKNSVKKLLTDTRSCCIVEKDFEELKQSLLRIVALYRVGALVELLSIPGGWLRRADVFLDLADRALECWRRKARVEFSDGVCRTSFSKFQDGFRLLMHAHAIMLGAGRVSVREHPPVTLEEVKRARRELFRGSEVISVLVDKEIGELERLRKRGDIPCYWTVYARVRGEEEEPLCTGTPGSQDIDRIKRNFTAHAGFLKELLEVRAQSDVELRVRPECWSIIEKVVDKIGEDLMKA